MKCVKWLGQESFTSFLVSLSLWINQISHCFSFTNSKRESHICFSKLEIHYCFDLNEVHPHYHKYEN